MCGPWLLTVHDVMSMMEYCFSHFDNIWPVPTHSIKGWAGLKRYCYLGNICRTFRNEMWPVVQFYLSNMFRPAQFQLQSGYQVLPPRCRWDLCTEELHQLQRRDSNRRVVGERLWRCRSQEFLLGLWHDFEMAVGSVRFTPWSENRKELKRFRLFAINVWCLSIPSANFSSEQDGSGRSTLGSEIKGLTGLNRYSYPCNCCRTFGYT